MGNSGGGLIVFGVVENDDNTLSIEGLDALKDKADISIDQYLPEDARDIYHIEDFDYSSSDWEKLEGKAFQVLFVDDIPSILPLICQKGKQGRINSDSIYIRKNTKSVEAGQAELNNLIDRRVREQVEQESADLREELVELRTLYDFASKDGNQPGTVGTGTNLGSSFLTKRVMPGRREEFHRYIEEKIAQKKVQINQRLGV
jgi:hypothetical protein